MISQYIVMTVSPDVMEKDLLSIGVWSSFPDNLNHSVCNNYLNDSFVKVGDLTGVGRLQLILRGPHIVRCSSAVHPSST